MCYNGFMAKKSAKQEHHKNEFPIEKTSTATTQVESENSSRADNEIPATKAEEILSQEQPNKKHLDRSKISAIRKKTMPVVLRLALSVLFFGAMSALFTWFLFIRHESYDVDTVMEFINDKPYLYAYSNLVIFLAMLTIATLTWTTFFSTGLSFAIISVISYIDMTKYAIREIPLMPEDFLLAGSVGELTAFVDIWEIVRLAVGVVLVVLGSALLEYCTRHTIGRTKVGMVWWERHAVVPRVSFTLIAVVSLLFVTGPVIHQKDYEWLEGMELKLWDPVQTYEENGFVIGFLSNIAKLDQATPETYSAEEMQRIAQKYRDIKATDITRKPLNEVIDNLIIVLDETFYDPELYDKYDHYGGDVIPETHAIFMEYPSGYMYSPEYGGGTANVEFEAYTGLSNYWARNYPYVNSLTQVDNILSAASWLKGFDFSATAIHSYDGSLYKRNAVYPRMGFDEFIDREKMTYTDKENSEFYAYISDQSLFREVLDVIKNNDSPQMIGAITMQNHSPYDSAQYTDLEFVLKGDAEQYWNLANSFQSLHSADAYIGEFLTELDKLEERTVVLLFGDHTAGILSEYVNSDKQEEQFLAYLTPFFIYSNFEIRTEDKNRELEAKQANEKLGFNIDTKGVDLPVTTPNCLLNTVYNLLNVEKPALFYLLDVVCEETPVLTAGYFAGNTPEEVGALYDYKLVNYDILSGKHYWDGN